MSLAFTIVTSDRTRTVDLTMNTNYIRLGPTSVKPHFIAGCRTVLATARAVAQARRAKDNSPAIHRWGTGARNQRVPSGTKERSRLDAGLLSPLGGLVSFRTWAPTVETVGYGRSSLRDDLAWTAGTSPPASTGASQERSCTLYRTRALGAPPFLWGPSAFGMPKTDPNGLKSPHAYDRIGPSAIRNSAESA